MLHVRALTGEPVAELHVQELIARLPESEELLVVALKRLLGAELGCSRFRLKLLGEDGKEIDDGAPLSGLTGQADFTLVRMDFQTLDVVKDSIFISACKGGRLTEVECLLHARQNPDARDMRNNFTGIHMAANNGHLDVVRLLLEARTDKDAALQNGATALHIASERGHLDVARLLLEAGADKVAVMQDGATALHMAAQHGRLDVVRLLLKAGANKVAAMNDGATALHLAAQNCHVDVVRLLLEADAARVQ